MDIQPITTEAPRKPRQRTPYDPNSFIVKLRHVQSVVGLSSVTIWRLRRAGDFPAPIRLSAGRIGWRRPDLEAWLEERRVAK